MKNKLKFAILPLLLIALISSLACIMVNVGAAETTGDHPVYPRYYLGEEIVVPEKKITVDGTQYDTETAIYHPDGKAYLENRLKLDELGVYIIEYRATVNGKLITEREMIETVMAPYTATDGADVEYGKDKSQYNTGIAGLNITLKKDEVFRYNEVINLKKINLESIIEMYVKPTGGAGTRDVGIICFKLEDANDPENYVSVYARSVGDDGGGNPWWSNVTYIQAGFAGQSTVGVEWGSGQTHIGDQFGFPVQFSMYGNRDFKASVGEEKLSFRYDVNTMELFGPRDGEQRHIVDLDDRTYFNVNWGGFSTNEVYLSVWGEQYYKDKFCFAITKIGNFDLSKEVIRDTEGPDIEIDYGKYSAENIPVAMRGCAYPVFGANASDVKQPYIQVNKRVIYNYGSSTRHEIPLNDGKFTPDKEGLYTVEYSAHDRYGNMSVKTVDVVCVGEEELKIQLGEGVKQCYTGYRTELAEVFVTGGSGVNPLDIQIIFGGEKIAVENNGFVPLKAGTYTVKYRVSDFVGHRAEKSYDIVVTNDLKPVLISPPLLPKYIIAGVELALPEAAAYDYNVGTEAECKTYVTDGANTEKEIASVHTFTPMQDGTANIVYRAGAGNSLREWKYTLPVIEAVKGNVPDLQKYFAGNNINSLLTKNGVNLTAANSGNADFEFIQPLYGRQINYVIRLDGNNSRYNKAVLKLEGRKGETAAEIEFTAYGSADAYSVKVDGVSTGIKVRGNTDISLVYDFETRTVSINGQSLKCNLSFTDGGYYFSGSLEKSVSGGMLRVVSLQGQTFTNANIVNAPEVQLNGRYSLLYGQNTALQVFSAAAYSVLSPLVKCTVSVTDADGADVYTDGGVALRDLDAGQSYGITLKKLGKYRVAYKIRDIFGSTDEQVYIFSVVDSVGPVITLDGNEPVKSVQVGAEIFIYPATGVDEVDGECKVICFIVDPSGDINPVKDVGKRLQDGIFSFKPSTKGKYIIRYFSVDKSGNTSIADYTVTAE